MVYMVCVEYAVRHTFNMPEAYFQVSRKAYFVNKVLWVLYVSDRSRRGLCSVVGV
jgi:hypothetical protein